MDKEKTKEYGLVGSIAKALYDFHLSGFDPKIEVYDRVDKRVVKASDYFSQSKQGTYICVKPGRLPYDLDVKGAYTPTFGKYRGYPFFEMSRIEFPELKQSLEGLLAKQMVEVRGRSIFIGDKKVIETRTMNVARPGRSIRVRTSLRLNPSYKSEKDLAEMAMHVMDVIYDSGHFYRDPEITDKVSQALKVDPEKEKDPRAPKLELRLALQLQQVVRDEQKLALFQTVSPRMIRSLQLLRMSGDELRGRMSQVTSDNPMLEQE